MPRVITATVRTATPRDANLTKRAGAYIDVGQALCLTAINAESDRFRQTGAHDEGARRFLFDDR